jgi:para-nitrobenzyl esterase
MQSNRLVDWYANVARVFGHGPEVVSRPSGFSEDCLYLNVWTPKPGAESNLPVMVFVHGGSNSSGWSYEPNYGSRPISASSAAILKISRVLESHPVRMICSTCCWWICRTVEVSHRYSGA